MKGKYRLFRFVLFFVCAGLMLFVGVVPVSMAKTTLTHEIEKAVSAELAKALSSEFELESVRIVKGGDGINGDDEYVVTRATVSGYSGRNRITLALVLSDKRAAKLNVTVEASYDIPSEVFITTRPLSSGTVLAEADIMAVKQKSSRLPLGAITDKQTLVGGTLKTNIGQGVILRASYVLAGGSMKRGQKVTVIVEGDNVSISTTGMLRADAAVGNNVKVYCESSKKEVVGMLESSNTVRVKI